MRDYFAGGGAFVPTDVEFLDGLLYITTGYSSLDTVLTARVSSYRPLKAAWYDLAFGGRGTGPGQLGTGHGITVPPGTKRIDVADRANGEIDRFTRHGQYLSTLRMPAGLPALRHRLPRPLRGRRPPSTVRTRARARRSISWKTTGWSPRSSPRTTSGLVNFKHVHNAVLREAGGKLYVIAQAWNPGDFAVLEQVTP